MKKSITLIALLLCIVMILAACAGNGSTPSGASNNSPSNASGNTSDNAQSNTSSSASVNTADNQSGNTSGNPTTPVKDSVVIAQSGDNNVFTIFDSGAFLTANSYFGAYNLYDAYFRQAPDGSVSPALAKEASVSDDGLVWTITLRDDVYFHNGYKLTAADAVWSLETLRELVPNEFTGTYRGLELIEQVDEYTLKLTLSAPYAPFRTVLSKRHSFVFCKQYWEEVGGLAGYQANPIGTGAYKFVSYTSGENLILEANENYWGIQPTIKHITLRPIGSVATQFLSLENGEVDVILGADPASCLQINSPNLTFSYNGAAGRNVLRMMCVAPSPLQDINLRRAIQSAINKEDVLIGSAEGYGTLMDFDVVPMWSGTPDVSKMRAVPYDMEKAKEYLAASDYKGQALRLVVSSGSALEKAAQIIQGKLMEININIEVVAVDGPTAQTYDGSGGDLDMLLTGYGASEYDVANMRFPHLASTTRTPYVPADVLEHTTALLTKSNSEMDLTTRQATIEELLYYINDQVLVVPLYNAMTFVAHDTSLSGVSSHPVGNVAFVETWRWN